jgi:hypothetical protein
MVLLFVPNLICYARLLLLVPFTFLHAANAHEAALAVYAASTALDFVDGIAARAFNQCSKFGEVLDIVVDWCANFNATFLVQMRYTHIVLACVAVFRAAQSLHAQLALFHPNCCLPSSCSAATNGSHFYARIRVLQCRMCTGNRRLCLPSCRNCLQMALRTRSARLRSAAPFIFQLHYMRLHMMYKFPLFFLYVLCWVLVVPSRWLRSFTLASLISRT